MITITRAGSLGPLDALELRDEFARVAHQAPAIVTLDLKDVQTIHPAVTAAIVAGAAQVRRGAGRLRLIEPSQLDDRNTVQTITMQRLTR